MTDYLAGVRSNVEGLRLGTDTFWTTDFCRTRSLTIDWALGGGFGYGRISELLGEYATGKSAILYLALAENQRMGGISVLYESEGAFDRNFFSMLGGDPTKLLLMSVATCEDVFDGMMAVIAWMDKSKVPKTVPVMMGWDSIAQTGTKHLLETTMETRDMSKAFIMSSGVQKITAALKDNRVALIATNQLREQIGIQTSEPHGPGGKAWPYASSQRIMLKHDGGYKGSQIFGGNTGNEEIGRWVRGKVIKNRLASPFAEFTYPFYFRTGTGLNHPTYGTPLKFGICEEEALWFFYVREHYRLPDNTKVIEGGAGGRYRINEQVVAGLGSFYAKEWPDILKDHQELRNMPFDKAKAEANKPVPKAETQDYWIVEKGQTLDATAKTIQEALDKGNDILVYVKSNAGAGWKKASEVGFKKTITEVSTTPATAAASAPETVAAQPVTPEPAAATPPASA